jgi:hypothetical protein
LPDGGEQAASALGYLDHRSLAYDLGLLYRQVATILRRL